jgi:signal transduction histidine kinase
MATEPPGGWPRFWRYGRALLAPLLIWVLLVAALINPLSTWLRGEDSFDEAALREWLEEARNHEKTLADLINAYLRRTADYVRLKERLDGKAEDDRLVELLKARGKVAVRREEIYQHLQALGEPATKVYPGQLLLFPTIYRLEVAFDLDLSPEQLRQMEKDNLRVDEPVVWDSGLPSGGAQDLDEPADFGQYQERTFRLHPRASVRVRYQLHAFNKRQRIEQEQNRRLRQLGLLALTATVLGLSWMIIVQHREREQERQRLRAEHQVAEAERQLLQEEARHAETERRLLEQQVATQTAERQALELKSHLYASIGIMAGSYAHNIKNLLVRPNDLLRRCLESEGLPGENEQMLREVQQTLGTVTERLHQILHTVARDPSRSERRLLDLNDVLRGLAHTWQELARDRWKLDLVLDVEPPGQDGGLSVEGDLSHLQQAAENLLFNARDATFEMRNHLRERARRSADLNSQAGRRAVIEAAAWRGRVVLRARRQEDAVVLEVRDNGAGMTEEVRRRCTETHFSTKRNNALYEGHSTGMGLGLSFVVAILEHHRARLEIESAPQEGTVFRVRFPPVARPEPPHPPDAPASDQSHQPDAPAREPRHQPDAPARDHPEEPVREERSYTRRGET